jgi:hypothetical protein
MKFGNFSAPRFGQCAMEEPDHRHGRLLRPRHEWPPSRRAAEQRDELTTLQSIELHPLSIQAVGDSIPHC